MRAFILAILLPTTVWAQDQASTLVASLETGVICSPESVGTSPAPDTIAGVTNVIAEDPPFVSLENTVPAVLGIGFGAKVKTTEPLGLSNVTMIIRHPAMGDDGITLQSFNTRISGLDPSLTFYQFDYAYELRPGRWTMEARLDDQLIYRSQFEVVDPRELPELAGVCGYLELLS